MFALAAALVFGVSGTSATAEPASAAPASAAPSVLTIISGSVLVRHPDADFMPAHDGDALAVGDTVRTEADSRAVLTMFEGSTVELEPLTEITIDDASRHADSTIVLFTQMLGRTWHVVTHLLTPDSRYNVKTPAATASVRGTAFEVTVSDRPGEVGATTVTTTNGAVATLDASGGAEVLVTPSMTTTVQPGGSPSAPRPAPEPARVVTVAVSGAAAIVTDPLGRSNGVKDGKLVVQTPGATVSVSGGVVTVSMPNLPDGQLTTRVEGAANATATVTTTVTGKGAEPSTTRAEVSVGSSGSGTTTVDLKGANQKDSGASPAGDSGKGATSAPATKTDSSNGQKASGTPASDQKTSSTSNDQKTTGATNDQKAVTDQKPAEQKSRSDSKPSTDSKPAQSDRSSNPPADAAPARTSGADQRDTQSKPDKQESQSNQDTQGKADQKAKAEPRQSPPAKETPGKPH